MFIKAEVSIALPFAAAKEALGRAMSDGGLVAESRRAVEDGLVFVMPVGSRGSHGPARQVLVRLLPGRWLEESFVVPLRWDVSGPAGRLFPALDANLGLDAADGDLSSLWVIGRYDPPLGRLGSAVDRAGMSKVADATMAALLREVAAHLERRAQLSGPNMSRDNSLTD